MHTTDGTDFTGLLKGGELILTDGSAFTGSVWEAMAYFDELVRNGVSGVMISPLEDRPEAKSVLREASRDAGLPVILLKDRVPFVDLTEAVHRLLLAEDADGRTGDHAVLELVDRLSVESTSPAEVLRKTSEILLAPVVYEDLHHRVVMLATANISVERLLSGWAGRSRRVSSGAREEEWPQVAYRENGRPVGRLLVPEQLADPHAPVVLERAAQLLERFFEGLSTPASSPARSLIQLFHDLRTPQYSDEQAAVVRAEAAGLGAAREYLPAVFLGIDAPAGRARGQGRAVESFLDDLYEAAHEIGVELTAGEVSESSVGALLGAPVGAERREVLRALVHGVRRRTGQGAQSRVEWSMAVGAECESLHEAAVSGVGEAAAIARAARDLDVESDGYYTSGDVRLRRLLSSLSGDPRLLEFTADSLAALKRQDPRLIHTVRRYIELNGNIAELARALFLSRPSVYARIRRIEEIIGGSLDRVDVRIGLYVAILVDASVDAGADAEALG